MSSNLFKNKITHKLFTYKSYAYTYKQDLALNDLPGLICYKAPTKLTNKQESLFGLISREILDPYSFLSNWKILFCNRNPECINN